jgi:hypothetical protein
MAIFITQNSKVETPRGPVCVSAGALPRARAPLGVPIFWPFEAAGRFRMEAVKSKKTFTISEDQLNKLNWHLADLGALIGCLTVATEGAQELGIDFDLEHYVAMVEDHFNNLVGDFNQTVGQSINAQRMRYRSEKLK